MGFDRACAVVLAGRASSGGRGVAVGAAGKCPYRGRVRSGGCSGGLCTASLPPAAGGGNRQSRIGLLAQLVPYRDPRMLAAWGAIAKGMAEGLEK
jgi:hypothetical protein